MQAMIDKLEENKIVAKAKDLNIIPKYASPTMLVLKHSSRKLSEQQYQSLPVHEKIEPKT